MYKYLIFIKIKEKQNYNHIILFSSLKLFIERIFIHDLTITFKNKLQVN